MGCCCSFSYQKPVDKPLFSRVFYFSPSIFCYKYKIKPDLVEDDQKHQKPTTEKPIDRDIELSKYNQRYKYIEKETTTPLNYDINVQQPIIKAERISYSSSKFKWQSYTTEIERKSIEFYIVERLCCLPFEILKIEKIVNFRLYLKYVEKKYLTFLDNKKVLEHVVFHGNKNDDPNKTCLSETGLDFRDNQNKPLGRGIHYSDDSIFSHENAFQNNSIRKIVMAKIIAGNIHEIAVPDPKLQMPPKNFNLITTMVKNTQRIYACYENFNVLPWYIISYDSSKEVMPPFIEYWCWEHIPGVFIPLNDDINMLVDMQYREGTETATRKFKFSKFSNREMFYDIVLKGKCIFIKNTESGELVKLEKRCLKDCKRIDELKEKFLTDLDQDTEDLKQIFSDYEFPDDEVEKSVKGTLTEIEQLIRNTDAKIVLIPINSSNVEFNLVKTIFEETMSSKLYKITNIEKVDNKLQNLTFLIQKCLIELDSGNANIKYLFHGTQNNNPEVIYNDKIGFDMRYSKAGYWGKGTYFAVKAIYSHNYAYRENNLKKMFLVEVILGKCTERQEIRNRSLKKPMPGYDTTYAHTDGSDIYIKYENSFAYPTYLISYEKI